MPAGAGKARTGKAGACGLRSAEASRSWRPCTNAASSSIEFWTLVTASAREYSLGSTRRASSVARASSGTASKSGHFPFGNYAGYLSLAFAGHPRHR